MANYQALSRTKHQYSGVKPNTAFSFAAQQAAMPVLAEEVPHILPTMPLAFVAQNGTGAGEHPKSVQLMALQAFQPNENLYLQPDGRWLGGYKPASYRGYPFVLLPNESSDQLVLCIDEDSDVFSAEIEEEDRRLFTADGEPSELVQNVLQFLKAMRTSTQQTQMAVDQIHQAGLLEPWELKVQSASKDQEPTETTIGGLYRVNESALKNLSGDELQPLVASGVLSLAYSQLLSTHRLSALARLYELRKKLIDANEPQEDVDLDNIFGGEDDLFKF